MSETAPALRCRPSLPTGRGVDVRFSAVLLAGGLSTRMGRDKAFLEIDGAPLWQRQLRILRDLSPNEIFIAGAAHEAWLAEECTIVPDAQPDTGPLAGLTVALRRCATPLLLALAIDLPTMTSGYLRELVASCSDGRGIIPRAADRFEPLAAVYPIETLPLAESCLEMRRYSLQTFAERCMTDGLLDAKPIAATEAPLFFNLNTPDDLSAFSEDASPQGHNGSQRKIQAAKPS